jgi:hypothetical protein
MRVRYLGPDWTSAACARYHIRMAGQTRFRMMFQNAR